MDTTTDNSAADTEVVEMAVPTPIPTMLSWVNNIGFDLLRVGSILVRNIDLAPGYAAELIAAGANRYLVSRLERLGRRQLDERLVLDYGPVASRMVALPLSEQRQILDNGVEVLHPGSLQDYRIIQYHELTSGQMRQVLAKDHVRSLAEQRTYVDDQMRMTVTTAAAPEPMPWKKIGHKIQIDRGDLPPLILMATDIRSMLALITK